MMQTSLSNQQYCCSLVSPQRDNKLVARSMEANKPKGVTWSMKLEETSTFWEDEESAILCPTEINQKTNDGLTASEPVHPRFSPRKGPISSALKKNGPYAAESPRSVFCSLGTRRDDFYRIHCGLSASLLRTAPLLSDDESDSDSDYESDDDSDDDSDDSERETTSPVGACPVSSADADINSDSMVNTPRHTPSKAFFWQDPKIMNARVFQTRINNSASKMQAMIRGFLQRKAYYRLLIKKGAEDKRQLQLQRESEAATIIQAHCRGYLSLVFVKVKRLEKQLADIERKKTEDLRQINRWKLREMSEIQKMIDADLDHFCGMKAEARVNLDCIEQLRSQNAALHEKNMQLRHDVADLTDQNADLESEMNLYQRNTPLVRDRYNQLIRDHPQWQRVNDMYEQKAREFKRAIGQRERAASNEKKIQRRYQRTVRKMIQKVEERSDDPGLARSVLMAMPCDMSNRTVAAPSPRRKSKPKLQAEINKKKKKNSSEL